LAFASFSGHSEGYLFALPVFINNAPVYMSSECRWYKSKSSQLKNVVIAHTIIGYIFTILWLARCLHGLVRR